jgi:phage recombination protein Bet
MSKGKEVAVIESHIPSLAMSEGELMGVLRDSLYPGAKDASIKMVIGWCRAQQKDPMKRPVHIVPMSVKKPGTQDQYEWRDILMPGIGDYRTDASRTGQYAGIDEAKFGPTTIRKFGEVEAEFPEWAEVTVYRLVGGVRCPFSSGKIRWLETYATVRKDSKVPNAMWRKRSFGQLEKCAEAMALRRAFPEVGSQPTKEEMEGRVIDLDDVSVTEEPQGVAMPKRASEKPAPEREPPPIEGEAHRVEEPAAPEEKSATPAPSTQAPESAIRMIRRKLEGAPVDEADLCKELKIPALDAITTTQANEALKWINSQ